MRRAGLLTEVRGDSGIVRAKETKGGPYGLDDTGCLRNVPRHGDYELRVGATLTIHPPARRVGRAGGIRSCSRRGGRARGRIRGVAAGNADDARVFAMRNSLCGQRFGPFGLTGAMIGQPNAAGRAASARSPANRAFGAMAERPAAVSFVAGRMR